MLSCGMCLGILFFTFADHWDTGARALTLRTISTWEMMIGFFCTGWIAITIIEYASDYWQLNRRDRIRTLFATLFDWVIIVSVQTMADGLSSIIHTMVLGIKILLRKEERKTTIQESVSKPLSSPHATRCRITITKPGWFQSCSIGIETQQCGNNGTDILRIIEAFQHELPLCPICLCSRDLRGSSAGPRPS